MNDPKKQCDRWRNLNILPINGRIANIPQNCIMKNWNVTMKTGLRVRLRRISWSFCPKVGGGCGHLIPFFSHGMQAVDDSLYLCSSVNSVSTAFGATQPRSHCRDFNASLVRLFDRSQIGVSGTFNRKGTFISYVSYFY